MHHGPLLCRVGTQTAQAQGTRVCAAGLPPDPPPKTGVALYFWLCMLFSVATRCPRPVHTALAASGARAFGGSPLTLHGASHGHGSHGPKFPDFNNPSEAYQVWGLGRKTHPNSSLVLLRSHITDGVGTLARAAPRGHLRCPDTAVDQFLRTVLCVRRACGTWQSKSTGELLRAAVVFQVRSCGVDVFSTSGNQCHPLRTVPPWASQRHARA